MVRPLETKRTIAIVGPTASGKSGLAMQLAAAIGGEIVACDSVQVYTGFDIGAAKPSPADRGAVAHHLLDVVEWHEGFDAAQYARAAKEAVAAIHERGRPAILCGGTGLYLRAFMQESWHDELPKDEGLREQLRALPTADLYARLKAVDPERAKALHPNDRFRVVRAIELASLLGHAISALPAPESRVSDAPPLVVILEPLRADLHAKIAARTAEMIAGGLMDEVASLLQRGIDPGCKPMQSIGYKQAAAVLAGAMSPEDMPAKIAAATRQYAKRQATWFRKIEASLRLSEPALEPLLRLF